MNLREIQIGDFFNVQKIVEPEYYIYTFISDHLRRLYIHYWGLEPNDNTIYNSYKIKNNKLVMRYNVSLSDYIQVMQVPKRLNNWIFNYISDDKKFDRLKLYLYTMREELQKRYPDIKMVIVVYNPELDAFQTHKILPFRNKTFFELY